MLSEEQRDEALSKGVQNLPPLPLDLCLRPA
jgi:hypothetical protein